MAYNVLIVSGSERGMEVISQQVSRLGGSTVTVCTNAGESKRRFAEKDYDIVLINTPLTDEFGTDLAVAAVRNTSAGVIVIVKNDILDSVSAKMEMIGALTVAKPLSKSFFDSAFRLAAATRMRICLFKKENDRLRSRYEELRLVSQAKCCLIEYRDYTEEEAHKYIEKRAMDERRTKRDIAEDVIETYKID